MQLQSLLSRYRRSQAHRFSTLLLRLPGPLADQLVEIGKGIPDSLLVDRGRDDDPHITCLFGLHCTTARPVRPLLARVQRPVEFRLGPVSAFECPDYDVVKVDVHSPDCHRINELLRCLPHTSKFPEYKPHATIAYVKKGEGQRLARELGSVSGSGTITEAVFSNQSEDQTVIPLGSQSLRYARTLAGQTLSHPLVAGYRIEHALRHLSSDPQFTTDGRELARRVLEEGDTSALWPLNDELHDSNHPLAGEYNWLRAVEKLHLDKAVGTGIDVLARRMHSASPGMRLVAINRLHEALNSTPTDDPEPLASEVIQTLRGSGHPDDHLRESLDRHRVRNLDRLDQLNEPAVAEQAKRESLTPTTARPAVKVIGQLLPATRYERAEEVVRYASWTTSYGAVKEAVGGRKKWSVAHSPRIPLPGGGFVYYSTFSFPDGSPDAVVAHHLDGDGPGATHRSALLGPEELQQQTGPTRDFLRPPGTTRTTVEAPERFARVRKPIHELVRGTRLARALKVLAKDPHPDTARLSRSVLRDGDTVALQVLADQLDETDHPFAGRYDWRAAARRLHLDSAVHGAVYSQLREQRPEDDEHNIHHGVRVRADSYLWDLNYERQHPPEFPSQLTINDNHRLSHVHRAARAAIPDYTTSELEASLHRLKLKVGDQLATTGVFPEINRDTERLIHRSATESEPTPSTDTATRWRERDEHHDALQAGRFRFRRDGDPLGATINSEFNRVADELHQKQGVADLEEFKSRDHWDHLLRANKNDDQTALDTATWLLYGDRGGYLTRQHRPGQPLAPLVAYLSGHGPASQERHKEARRRVKTLSGMDTGVLESNRPVSDLTGERNKTRAFRARRKSLPAEEVARLVLDRLSQSPAGLTPRELSASLQIPVPTLTAAALAAGAKSQRIYHARRSGVRLFHPDHEPPPNPTVERFKKVLELRKQGLTYEKIAEAMGKKPVAAVGSYLVNRAREVQRAEKFSRASFAPLAPVIRKLRAARLVDKGIERWKGFTSSSSLPSPADQVGSHETDWETRLKEIDPNFTSAGDFHDLSAVLAGTKPAALVDGDFLDRHPVGLELKKRLEKQGHSLARVRTADSHRAVVGKKESVDRVIGALKGQGPDSHREVGRALGYPEEAVGGYRPERYSARNPKTSDFIQALRQIQSTNQEVRRSIAETVYKKLKLPVSAIRDAIHDTPATASANTAHSITHSSDPDRARFAAAFYGLQTNSRSLLVFHTDPEGPDSVYKVSVQGSGEKVRARLDRLGVHQRTLLPTEDGWDLVVFSPGSTLKGVMQKFASEVGSSLTLSRGVGEVIGDSPEAVADGNTRATYRSIIRSAERGESGARFRQKRPGGERPGAPTPAGPTPTPTATGSPPSPAPTPGGDKTPGGAPVARGGGGGWGGGVALHRTPRPNPGGRRGRIKLASSSHGLTPERPMNYEDLNRVLRYSSVGREEFEKAIDENPLESTNHLVYADWLQENGEGEEAEFRRALGEWVKGHSPHQPHGNSERPWKVSKSDPLPKGTYHRDLMHPTWDYQRYRTYRELEQALQESFFANRSPRQ